MSGRNINQQIHFDEEHPEFRYEPAVVIALDDLDKYFEEDSKEGKIFIANDFQVDTEEKRERLINMLTKTYSRDFLDEPINGANSLFEKVRPTMWIKPIGDEGLFIQPKFFTMLSKALTRDRVNILQHAIDPSYRLPNNLTPKGIVKSYLDAKFPRGLKAFHDHFDEIMDLLVMNSFRKRESKREMVGSNRRANGKRNTSDYIAMVIEKYRHLIFCHHLPVPSNQLFIMEKRGKNKVSEVPLMQYAFDAVHTVTSISSRIRPVTPREADRLNYKVMELMSEFFEKYAQNYLTSKPGVFRKNSYGTSSSFNARAVIVSRQGIQAYDEIIIPYALGFKILEIHIAKIYIDEKEFSPIDIFEMRAEYARQFNPEVHHVMMRLIQDFWGGRGWASNFLRHPFLSKLSSQFMYIPEVGTDPLDNTIQMSPMALKGPNADFDGDEMVLSLHLDKYTADLWSPTKPSEGALSRNEATAYSDDLDLSKPMILQFYRYLGYDKR